ncbi:MAG: restriction endonuclease [Actinomycetota bacterium]|nr:restriction endonuclease [Actinomycetota bacterium]
MTLDRRGPFEKARRLGTGAARITLDDNGCRKIIGTIARDLGVVDDRVAQPSALPDFYSPEFAGWQSNGATGLEAFEALVDTTIDGELFFYCLAAIHLRRLKYQRILAAQPLPTLEQVGPRALLQYGMAPPFYLATLLFWRKWVYDIDNRAAQETGYIFEPIIAASIGGVPYSAKRSPVKRRSGSGGRQVDCLRGDDAYELKLRVTRAASGQGRWDAELAFPEDCRASGVRPILIVFDSTESQKLTQLRDAYERAGGAHFVGAHAWAHLEDLAGATMGVFLEKYVRRPLESLLHQAPPMDELPPLSLQQQDGAIEMRLGDFTMRIDRIAEDLDLEDPGSLPDDIDDELPGP